MRKLPYKSRGSFQAVGKHPRGLQGRTAPQLLPRLMSGPTHTDDIAPLPQSSPDRLKSSAGLFLKQSIPLGCTPKSPRYSAAGCTELYLGPAPAWNTANCVFVIPPARKSVIRQTPCRGQTTATTSTNPRRDDQRAEPPRASTRLRTATKSTPRSEPSSRGFCGLLFCASSNIFS